MPARTMPSVADVPTLADRWCTSRNIISPALVTTGSTGKRWWRCPASQDHVYEASVQSMARSMEDGRGGCPFCRGLRPSLTNRLDVLHPWLAEQWHPTKNGTLTPDQIVAGTNKVYWWQCPVAEDHAWEAAPQHRLKACDGEGCPFCRNLRPSVTNRLDIHHPDIAAQWHPALNGMVTPADVVSSTQTRYWWRCPAGPDHNWLAQVHLRTGKGHGCPFCSNRRLSVTNSVAARFPDHAYLFHPTRNDAPADQTMANTEVKVWWQCPVAEDHEWRESAGRVAANSWAHGRTGCPACAGLQASTTNRLSNHPELAAELHPSKNGSLTADDVVAGTGRKLWWLCSSCGHEWDAIGANRLKGHGCPMCQRFSRSVLELALGYELTTIWPDLNLDQDKVVVAGKIRHVDLIVPSTRLIIEVDGAYRHAESTAKDTAKSAALRDAGWHVIRVREEPLAATHPHDVVVLNDSPVKVVADAVLARAAELGWADEVSTATYQDELEPRRLAAALGEMQRRRPGKRLVIPGTPKGPTRADRWQRNYDALLRFVIEHGHSRPVDGTVYDDLPLGAWVSQQRSRHRRGVLQPERATRLAALPGWTWDVSESEWEHGFARLTAYVAEHGTSRVPVAHRDADGYPLGTWVRTHRQAGHRKPLTDDQQRRLEQLPDWTFDNLQHVAWANGLAALLAFSAEHGHVRLPRTVRGTDADLIGFVARHRASYRRGELPADRVAALESVPGWSWEPQEAAWEAGFSALQSFAAREGHGLAPSDHREDGYPLGQWVREQRDRGGRTGADALLPERRTRLEAVSGWSWAPHVETWESFFAALQTFVAREGHAGVPTDHEEAGLPLGSWVIRHRLEFKNGLVPTDRAERLAAQPGWMWDTRQAAWDRHLRALRTFRDREGHARVPTDHIEFLDDHEPVKLGAWAVATRSRAKSGDLAPDRVADLDAIDGWVWDARAAAWELGYSALAAFISREGHADVPRKHLEGDVELGKWMTAQRVAIRSGRLNADRRARFLGAVETVSPGVLF